MMAQDEVLELLQAQQKRRFPLLVFSASDLVTYQNLLERLQASNDVVEIRVSEFCDPSGNINIDLLIERVKATLARNENCVLHPLGELLRCVPDEEFYKRLFYELEAPSKRGWNACVGGLTYELPEHFEQWHRRFSRRNDLPIYQVRPSREKHLPKVTVVFHELDLPFPQELCYTFCEYLMVWENALKREFPERLFVRLVAIPDAFRAESTRSVDFIPLRKRTDYLRRLLPFAPETLTERQARDLCTFFARNGVLEREEARDVLQREFGNVLNNNTIYFSWAEPYTRVRLFTLAKMEPQLIQSELLRGAFERSQEPDEVPRLLWEQMFETDAEKHREVAKTLTHFHFPPSSNYLERVRNVGPKQRILRLIAVDDTTSRLLLSSIGEVLKDVLTSPSPQKALEEIYRTSVMEHLAVAYPALYHYIFSINDALCAAQTPSLFQDYFSLYVALRVAGTHEVTAFEHLEKMASEIASKGLLRTQFESLPNHISNACQKDTKLVFVDGLGAEWLGLIYGLATSRKGIDIRIDLGCAAFPTTTEYNKPSDIEINHYFSLDEVYHSTHHNAQESLLLELQKVKEIVTYCMNEAVGKETDVVLFGDHGATCFSGCSGKIKGDVELIERYGGRFGRIAAGRTVPKTDDLIFEGGYAVVATHKSFTRREPRPTHGGATPEEALVPIVRFVPSMLPTVKVEPSAQRARYESNRFIAEIRTSRPLMSLELEVSGRRFKGETSNGLVWRFNITDLPSGEHIATLMSSEFRVEPKNVRIQMTRSLVEEDLL